MAVANARDAAALLVPLFAEAEGETLAVLYLDANRNLVAIETFGIAGAGEIELPMRAILAAALGHDAFGMIVAHNHPRGEARPSRADRAATRNLAEAAASLSITLFDHLIFDGGEWTSFRKLKLL